MPKPDYVPPDQPARDRIVAERDRNVVVDAGAGAGKTKTLVDRIVELVSPSIDAPAKRLADLAAITFTRRAAGELRLRVRERLLEELGTLSAKKPTKAVKRRLDQLAGAISELDGAFIGTIHGFADRLLRMRPVEAGLSPTYDIVEDVQELLDDVAERLTLAAAGGTLAETLQDAIAGGLDAALVAETEETVGWYLEAGLRAKTREGLHHDRLGLDALVRGFVLTRDVPPVAPEPPEALVEVARTRAKELGARCRACSGASPGALWIRGLGQRLERAARRTAPIALLAALQRAIHPFPKLGKKAEFHNEKEAWELYKECRDDGAHTATAEPLVDWMGARLVRTAPVVTALYEQVKSWREVVDQSDLLLKLRGLLRDHPTIRHAYQELFGHILVDEFQDTDPLQAEILCYLAERGATARNWREVRLAPGRLTIVGDPKQSIYRFRRADVGTYAEVRAMLESQGALVERLETNFRSRKQLIEFFDAQLAGVLGRPEEPGGAAFDPESGTAYYEPMLPGPTGETEQAVHLLRYHGAEAKLKAPEGRAMESEALARYLRWLVDHSGLEIRDRDQGGERPVAFGDVAILADKTTKLPLLFRAFERFGVPYAARGSTLFAREPVVRQLILGMRAIADRSDGVAQAALRRPPFFALDPGDAVAERCDGMSAPRAEQASEVISELSAGRFERSPAATVRGLIERSAFERTVALLPNGAQKLAAVYELCGLVDRMVHEHGCDFDGVTERLRTWIDHPAQVDPPSPITGHAVQVMTTHQSKGLEFPVTVLWDGFAQATPRGGRDAWMVADEGREWLIKLDQFEAGSADADAMRDRDKQRAKQERCRLWYVACTRARDLLVVPDPQGATGARMIGQLLADLDDTSVTALEPFGPGSDPAWARETSPEADFPDLRADPQTDAAVDASRAAWIAAAGQSASPRHWPVGVTALAAEDVESAPPVTAESEEEHAARRRDGRHGATFGTVVHHALDLLLRGSPQSPDALVQACADVAGLDAHRDEALADVRAGLAELDRRGWREGEATLHPEFPLSTTEPGGRLALGYLDLLVDAPDAVWIIDFKTDPAPPAGAAIADSHPLYVAQLTRYAAMLEQATAPGRPVRAALLFTQTGTLHVVEGGG
ncbi:MAG: UvrD-helicase domain-containing protein [Planctomycetota bacterium]|jgi:ATP-dependent helicase/nuclease subunit A